jgi:hypothetical protein
MIQQALAEKRMGEAPRRSVAGHRVPIPVGVVVSFLELNPVPFTVSRQHIGPDPTPSLQQRDRVSLWR